MGGPVLTRRQAQSALAEAAKQADKLHRTDRRFQLMLLIVAAVYLAIGILVILPRVQQPINPRLGIPLALLGALVAGVVLGLRVRAESRWGSAWFYGSFAAFSIWNATIVWASLASGWWGTGQPLTHFTVSAAVAALPLVLGAAFIGWRRR
jgi:hypothetical protein